MPHDLPESSKKVESALLEQGFHCPIVQFSSTTKTSKDAAAAIGCTLEQIGKSIVFKTRHTNKPVLVLASGPNRVNEKTLELYVGEPVDKADANFVKESTGYAIGGVPPLGHAHPVDIFIDEDLLKCEEVWTAAGTSNSVFKICRNDLLKIPAKVINIK